MFNQFSLLSGWLVMKAFFGWLGTKEQEREQERARWRIRRFHPYVKSRQPPYCFRQKRVETVCVNFVNPESVGTAFRNPVPIDFSFAERKLALSLNGNINVSTREQ